VDFSIGRERLFGALGVHRTQDRWLFELQVWALSKGISAWLCNLEPYEACHVAGIVERLFIDPQHGLIEVSLSDGTGTAVAQWGIRRPTPELALTPGTAVVLDGVAVIGAHGEFVIREPTFETDSFPDVA
jgi:hypothetical protein